MTFGPDIAVDGQKPVWLTDDTLRVAALFTDNQRWSGIDTVWRVGNLSTSWYQVTHIRLPAGHFAYKALEAGFTPWFGGDKPPHDYSIGRVLWRNGDICTSKVGWWNHHGDRRNDIIGYESSKTVIGPLQYTKPHAVASKLFADILQRLGRPMIEPVDTFEGVMQQLDNLTSVLVDRDQMHRTFIAILREEGAHALADKLETAWNLTDPLLIQARKLVEQHDDPVQAVYAALKGGDV